MPLLFFLIWWRWKQYGFPCLWNMVNKCQGLAKADSSGALMALNMIMNISVIEHHCCLIRMVFTNTLYILNIVTYVVILWIFSVTSIFFLAGIIFLTTSKQNSGRKLYPNHIVQWAAILFTCKKYVYRAFPVGLTNRCHILMPVIK